MGKPGIGFVLSISTYCLLFIFIYWGASQPELDVLWHAEWSLKQGGIPATAQENKVLWKTLKEHPEYSKVFLKSSSAKILGTTHKDSETQQILLFRKKTGAKLYINKVKAPLDLSIRIFSAQHPQGQDHTFNAPLAGAQEVKLPPMGSDLELIQVQGPYPLKWELKS